MENVKESMYKKVQAQKMGIAREQSALTTKEYLQFNEEKAFLKFRIARLKNSDSSNTEEIKKLEKELRENFGIYPGVHSAKTHLP